MSIDRVIIDNGEERRLGNIIPGDPEDHERLCRSYPVFGADEPALLIPESDWMDVVLEARKVREPWDDPGVGPAHDQDGISLCNASAVTGAFEDCLVEAGFPRIQLSAGDLYDRINGGGDNGSLLEDGMREACTRGMCRVSANQPYLWHRGWTPASAEERLKHVVLERWICPTFGHCFSAVARGFRIISGIPWYDTDKPDSDGWLSPSPRGNWGGHAMEGYAGDYSERLKMFGIWHRQSWGSWGYKKSRLCIPQARFGKSIGGWWAIRVAKAPENNGMPVAQ